MDTTTKPKALEKSGAFGFLCKNVTELFGARIRELRKTRGMTQERLADILDIEQKHISLIELGKVTPLLIV